METNRKTDEISTDNQIKLAQLYNAISKNTREEDITRIIDKHSDNLNMIIPENSIFEIENPELVGNTLLHFAFTENNKTAFEYLLEKGADYTIKNADGSTVLHEIIEKKFAKVFEKNSLSEIFEEFLSRFHFPRNPEGLYIDSILRAHLRDENSANPRNTHGVSHFHAACTANNPQVIELFLSNEVSPDHAVNADSPVFPGYTPLHIFAKCGCAEAAQVLLRHGASLEVKDAAGATPMQILLRERLTFIDKRNTGKEEDDEELMKKVETNEKMIKLFLELDETDGTIIVDDSGLSTLHVACTMLDTSLAGRLLENTSDVDHSVKMDSALWPGYTALHFAALSNIDTVKLLLNRGANMEAKNSEGSSLFDMCLERYELNDICYIISCHPIWRDIQFLNSDVRLVDFINALSNTSKLINMVRDFHVNTQSCLPLDSPLWPGSTPLHLAVIVFERKKAGFHMKRERKGDGNEYMQTIELFFNKEYFDPTVNVLAQDAYGRTPIHLAYRMQKNRILDLLFKHNDKIQNPIDIDNVSILHIACLMVKEQLTNELLSTGADVSTPILCDFKRCFSHSDVVGAGSTPLHLAMNPNNQNAMKNLLMLGADPFAQDVNGVTPVHQVLTSGRKLQSRIFISSTDLLNIAVTGGVTYLHIACIAGDREAVKKLIELGVDVNAPIAFELPQDNYSPKLVKLLTPYLESTPLHLALKCDSLSAVEVLISRGADLFASNSDESIPIVQILRKKYTKYANVLLLNLQYNDTMQAILKNKTGLTLLHIACNAHDLSLVRHLLNIGAEVNAQAHSDLPVWPGCTPLHVLLLNLEDRLEVHGRSQNSYIENFHVILNLLMSFGADLTLLNADNETPIDISLKLFKSYIGLKAWLCKMLPLGDHDYYDLNFVDDWGISLFQEACYQSDLSAIREFLKRGVDVNRQVDALDEDLAGRAALHFAAKQRWTSMIGSPRHLTTLELLLNHGADLRIKDRYGNTPLHIAVQDGSRREDVISMLIKYGADINALNKLGYTPFESLLSSSGVSSAEVMVFLQNGVHINSYNRVTGAGYIPLLIKNDDDEFDEDLTTMIVNTSDLTAADDNGRTIVHNVVSYKRESCNRSSGMFSICTRLVERGCDIDQQDRLGRTPLHTAVLWQNDNAVSDLLIINADASIVDNFGKTALDYVSQMCTCAKPCEDSNHEEMRRSFAVQFIKWELTGFQEFDRYRDLERDDLCEYWIQDYREQMNKAKKTYIIPGELTPYDFAAETGAISSYLHMPMLQRNEVDEFFKTTKNQRFGKFSYWLKNHYRKAVLRMALIESATQSLNTLLSFAMPQLCSDNILRYLSNAELKNLIAAEG